MRTAGFASALVGVLSVALGGVAIWSYGKTLGGWAYRMFVVEIKLGFVALGVGLILMALSLVA